jgi:diguanylate cyclase (GGDEF)-like protein/PAS domain S-box-containing protein
MEIRDEVRGAEILDAELRALTRGVVPCASLLRANGAPENQFSPTDLISPTGMISPTDTMESLLLRWRVAVDANAPHRLPPFEELVIGSVGGLADTMVLAHAGTGESLALFRLGTRFAGWIGARDSTVEITPRSTGRARVLHEAVTEALADGRPVRKIAHALVNFVVCSDDVVALPFSNRWGPPLCLVYVFARERAGNLLECLFQATPEGQVALVQICGKNGAPRDFQILMLNDGAAALLQRPAEELTGQRLGEVAISLGEPRMIDRLLDVVASGENARFELDQPTADGDVVHLNVGATPSGDFVVVTLGNIGDVKRREASFRMLFKNNPVPMWLCDATDHTILAVNDAATALYGYDRSAVVGLRLCGVVSCGACRDMRSRAADGVPPSSFEQVARHTKADGSEIDVHIYGRAIVFEGAAANLVTIIDVTEQRRAEARIEYIAHHDGLTGLPNRVLFLRRLGEAIRHADEAQCHLAVLSLDLDHFKNVNDRFGHPTGDRLLCVVGRRLRQLLRQTDFVARLGGDEFAIIQSDLETQESAALLARRIVDALCVPFELDGHQVTIGASIGIAFADGNGEASVQLMRNADIALYRAKEDGRRTYCIYSPDLKARVLARSTLEQELRDAYARGEFELFYQPLVGLATGAINGFEALLRWNHPTRGVVAPGAFIGLAEEIGLIVPLGEWVLRQACLEAMHWPDDLRVSVNLSPAQFTSGDLVQTVLLALALSGLSPGRLELEITETVLLAECEAVLATMHDLRDTGVGVSMDDFGSGYSSFSYLRAFPFTKIKIDRSFVTGIAESEQCMAIIHAATGLGSSLGMAITAEGVETLQQLEWLRREGCTEVQGYLVSPPVPSCEIPGLLERGSFSLRRDDNCEAATATA